MMCFPPPHTGAESCICKGDPQIGLPSGRTTRSVVLLTPVQIKGKVGGDHEEHSNSHCLDDISIIQSHRRLGAGAVKRKIAKTERKRGEPTVLLRCLIFNSSDQKMDD
mmetsp:Transcript_31784/g.95154  ORF Transcript_31784/g.95154 Transcript_31784/m.95154 type:complete len:108 (-) Transcript_31784:11-334(-)